MDQNSKMDILSPESSGIVQTNSNFQDEVSLKDLILKIQLIFKYLLSKWVMIIFITLIGSGLGYVYSRFKMPVYIGEATFVLEVGGAGGMSQYAGLASIVGMDIGGGSASMFSGDNIIELYKSRSMIQRALLSPLNDKSNRRLLIDYYIDFNDLRNEWDSKQDLKNISFSDSSTFTIKHDSILKNIVNDINKNYLDVSKPDKKLSIIKVSVESENEFFAKLMVDNLVRTVNNFYIQTKTKTTQESVNLLQRQTDSVRTIMTGAIFSSATTIDATPNLNRTRQVLLAPSQKSQVNIETNKAILTELIKNLELSKMSLRQQTPLIQIIDRPILPLEKQEFGSFKGLVLGGLLFGFFTILILSIKFFLRNLLA